MARREWALKIVGKQVFHDRRCGPIVNFPRAVKLVTVEHARAVRIVKRHLKMVMLDRHVFTAPTRKYLIAMLREVLADLTKGRT